MIHRAGQQENPNQDILIWDTQDSNQKVVRRRLRDLRKKHDVGIVDQNHDLDILLEIKDVSQNLDYSINVSDSRELDRYKKDIETQLNNTKDQRKREELLIEMGRIERISQIYSESLTQLAQTEPEVILVAIQTGYIILRDISVSGIKKTGQRGIESFNQVCDYLSTKGEKLYSTDEIDKETKHEVEEVQSKLDDWK